MLWITIGGAILLWLGYLIYKLHLAANPGSILLLTFLLLFSLAIAVGYILITLAGKIISFSVKKIKK